MDARHWRNLAIVLGAVVLGGVWGWPKRCVGAEPPSTTDTSVTAPKPLDDPEMGSDKDELNETTPDTETDEQSEQQATPPAQAGPQGQSQEKPDTAY